MKHPTEHTVETILRHVGATEPRSKENPTFGRDRVLKTP